MKKSWVLGLLALAGLGVVGYLWADGSFVSAPGPVISATGQNYYYPSAQSPAAGGLLVQDGASTFRYSNATIVSTTSLTVLQFPALPVATSAQILALTAATTGQMVMCNNCANVALGNGGAGVRGVCVSTGSTTSGQFVPISSSTLSCI